MRPPRVVLLLALFAVPAWASDVAEEAAGEAEECPADGSGPAQCRGEADAGVTQPSDVPSLTLTRSVSAQVPYAGRQADLITQEIDELEGVLSMGAERVRLLKELRETLASGHDVKLPHAGNLKVLTERLPLFSEVSADALSTPIAASEDYLVSKVIIPFDEGFDHLKFLPLRSPRAPSSQGSTSSSTIPNTLLVAVRKNGDVHLLTPSGDLAQTFSAGHDAPVTQLAVPSSHEEYLMATADSSGVIRVHKVNVRQKKADRKDRGSRKTVNLDKVSQHLGQSANVTVQLQKAMSLPHSGDGEAPQITTLAVVSQGSTKFVLAGDSSGKITAFTRNGTVAAVIDVSEGIEGIGGAVDSLQAVHGSVMYRAGQDWGFIDLERMQLKHVDCEMFSGRVMDAVVDGQLASRVYVADEDGTVWVFSIKNKRECKLDLKFANGTTGWPLSLNSVRGFALGLETSASGQVVSLLALNVSQVSKPARAKEVGERAAPPPPPPPQPILWRRERTPVRDWAVHRRSKEGDLLAFLSEDGREIEIMELLMTVYTPPAPDQFGNFKMPVIAVAVVLVLGYQYMKNKGKGFPGVGGGGGGGGGARGGKMDFGSDDFAALLRKKKGGGAGLGGLGGGGLGGLKKKGF